MESRQTEQNPQEAHKLDEVYQQLENLQTDYRRATSELNFLKHAAARLNFFDNAHDGIVFTDDRGWVLYANPYFLEMMQLAQDDVLGKPLPDSIWENRQDGAQLFQDIQRDGFVHERELHLHRRDGVSVFATCSAVANFDDKGAYIGAELMLGNITRTRQAQIELLQQNSLLDALLSSTLDPVIIMNADLEVVKVNVAGLELFHLEAGFSRHPYHALLLAGGFGEPDVAALEIHLAAGQPFRYEVALHDQHYRMHCVPLEVSPHGWAIVLHNITSLKEHETVRTHLLQMVTHDLKNPLAIIIGLAAYLKEELPPDYRALAERILRNGRRMDALINNLLGLERLKAGRLELAPTDLGPVIMLALEEYEDEAGEKMQTLRLEGAADGILVEADAAQLQEAIGNLISNAIKYTPEQGTIVVRVQADERQVSISIHDNGIGIAPDMQDQLFQPFFRVRSPATSNIAGTGLGLNLVKSVIDAHKGQIYVKSAEGQGSTFTVELPRLIA